MNLAGVNLRVYVFTCLIVEWDNLYIRSGKDTESCCGIFKRERDEFREGFFFLK